MSEKELSQGQKFVLDLGPLLVFFAVNWKMGLIYATAALMIATFICLGISYYFTRKINKVTLVGALFIAFFGIITLYFQDAFYLKLKVSLINVFFAALLMGGMWFGRLFIKDVMGSSLEMPDSVWRTLTWRWALFFIILAALNVVVWQTMSENAWVNFKTFGLLGLTLVFAISNAPLMSKYFK